MRCVHFTVAVILLATVGCPGFALAQHPPPITSSVNFSLSIPFPTGNLRVTGFASAAALITFLKNGSVMGTTVADSGSHFDKTLTGLNPGVITISMYATDVKGRNTVTLSFDVNIISGTTITLGDFLLPTTVGVGKEVLKRPETQTADGYAKSSSKITSFFNSSPPITKEVNTANDGSWQAKVPEVMHLGSHNTNALVQDSGGNQSLLSQSVPFKVVLSADLNVDNKVNLTDFSILMFSYGTAPPPNLAADINDNSGAPDLVDFSIMMFYWTGG